MKPFTFAFLILLFTQSAQGETSGSLTIVGRVPASVSVDIDQQDGILRARSNFPFLMSYKNESDSETRYVVRMAKEGESKILPENSREPLVLEIIAP